MSLPDHGPALTLPSLSSLPCTFSVDGGHCVETQRSGLRCSDPSCSCVPLGVLLYLCGPENTHQLLEIVSCALFLACGGSIPGDSAGYIEAFSKHDSFPYSFCPELCITVEGKSLARGLDISTLGSPGSEP